MKMTFGGNTDSSGLGQPSGLDYFLLEEDVAYLAMISYRESIRDYSFVSNPGTIHLYFKDAIRALTIFSGMLRI